VEDVDIMVIGAGVAGLTAAMTAARHGLKVVVVDRMGVGGQVSTAATIENFPGFPQGIGGHELGPLLHEQAEAAGAEFVLDTIEAVGAGDQCHQVRGATQVWHARAVIVAAGSSHRTLGIPGEAQFLGKGVSHCASCDGPFFAGLEVAVVGGGDTALDEALVLAAHASRVTLVHRGAHLRAQLALVERAKRNGKIEIMVNTIVEEIVGCATVSAIRWREVTSGTTREMPVRGVFVNVGLEPNTEFLRDVVALDAAGHIETDTMMRTSRPGVFAAGDIRQRSVALLAACAGDGATAAIAAIRYVAAHHRVMRA
jgi:thioredoxin reductase (NADPH)